MNEVTVTGWESPRFPNKGQGSSEEVHLVKNTACECTDRSGRELGKENEGFSPWCDLHTEAH